MTERAMRDRSSVGRIAEQFQPIVSTGINASPLVGALARSLAALVDAHIMPQHEQIQVSLGCVSVVKGASVVQEHLEQ